MALMSREPRSESRRPLPPGIQRDWSGGLRAHVSDHAVRRYAERVLGWITDPDLSDPEALDRLADAGLCEPAVRERLSYLGGVALRFGSVRFLLDRRCIGVLRDGRVVTVRPPRGTEP